MSSLYIACLVVIGQFDGFESCGLIEVSTENEAQFCIEFAERAKGRGPNFRLGLCEKFDPRFNYLELMMPSEYSLRKHYEE
jgi:hypothetical protein